MANPLQYITKQATTEETQCKCPYAGVSFALGDALAICSVCGTIHLKEAWEENGGCTTYGCKNAPDFRKDQPEIRIDILTPARSNVQQNQASTSSSHIPVPPIVKTRTQSTTAAPASLASTTRNTKIKLKQQKPTVVKTEQYIAKQATAEEIQYKCPYAGVSFALGDALAICSVCGTIHLKEAWEENGGCTTYGCKNAPDFRKDQPVVPVAASAPVHPNAQETRTGNLVPRSHSPTLPPRTAAIVSSKSSQTQNTKVPLKWIPVGGARYRLLTWTGFVIGLASVSSPTNSFAPILGLIINGISLRYNLSQRDIIHLRYSVIGGISSILSFFIGLL